MRSFLTLMAHPRRESMMTDCLLLRAAALRSPPAVTEEDVADIVAMVTGIPLAKVAKSETEKLLHMNDD